MQAIKSILVPVDFSELAANAYQFALGLADEFSASVQLLYCMSPAPALTTQPGFFQSVSKDLQKSAEANLQKFQETGILRAGLKHRPVVTRSVFTGTLKEGITEQKEQREVDLVLIGTHGVQDSWDQIFSTNAASLVGNIEIPLLILPAGVAYHPFKSVCFATELRDRDVKLATQLNQVLYPFLPHIHFLHVQDPQEALPTEGLGFFRRAFERHHQGMAATFTTVTNRDVTDGIFDYLGNHHHDLLVMIKPELGWWKRMMSHSETEETAGITTIPLLIMGENN